MLSASTAERIRRSVPAETRRAYAGDWRRFTDWAAGRGLAPLPAAPQTLAEYAAALADADRAPSTTERALAAIATAHRSAGHPRPDNTLARAVLRDHRRQRAAAGRGVRKAAPVTVGVLRRLITEACAIERNGIKYPAGVRDRALLLLGFALGVRRSELVAIDIADLAFTDDGLQVTIRRSKTDRDSAGRIVAVPNGQHPETCPVRAVKAWCAWLAERGHTTGPLFVRIDRRGVIGHVATGRGTADGRLTGQAVSYIVNRAAQLAEIDAAACWSGHSLRRGFATEAYRAGADPLRIARHAGWADGSPTLLGYVEDVDRWNANPLIGVGL